MYFLFVLFFVIVFVYLVFIFFFYFLLIFSSFFFFFLAFAFVVLVNLLNLACIYDCQMPWKALYLFPPLFMLPPGWERARGAGERANQTSECHDNKRKWSRGGDKKSKEEQGR